MSVNDIQTRVPDILAATLTFLPLAIFTVALRLWVRTRMVNALGWDDTLIVFALFTFLTYIAGCLVIVFRYGGGTHIENFGQMKVAVNWVVVDEVFYLATTIFLKLSLGVFFLRICIKKWQMYLIYGLMTFNTLINVYHILFITFMCGSPGHFLTNAREHKCVANRVILGVAYEQGVITTSTDWIFAALPVAILWHTKMDRRTKAVCAFLLSLGAFGSLCSIVRFRYINGLSITPDFFWNAANISIWSTIELGTGIVAGSLATLRPLFKHLFYSARHRVASAAGHAKRHSQALTNRPSSLKRDRSDSFSSGRTLVPWEHPANTHIATHLTSCYGPDEINEENTCREDKRMHFMQARGSRSNPNYIWHADPEKVAAWPYWEDVKQPGPGEISKVVDVEVSVLRQVGSSAESLNSMDKPKKLRKPEKAARRSCEKLNEPRSTPSHDELPKWERIPSVELQRQSWLNFDIGNKTHNPS